MCYNHNDYVAAASEAELREYERDDQWGKFLGRTVYDCATLSRQVVAAAEQQNTQQQIERAERQTANQEVWQRLACAYNNSEVYQKLNCPVEVRVR